MSKNKYENKQAEVLVRGAEALPVLKVTVPETKDELLEAIQTYNDSLNHHSEQIAFHYEQGQKYREAFDKLKAERETLFKQLRKMLHEIL